MHLHGSFLQIDDGSALCGTMCMSTELAHAPSADDVREEMEDIKPDDTGSVWQSCHAQVP